MSTSTLHSDKSRVEIARPAYAVAIAVAVIALILSAIGFLDSEWLQNRLRDQIIAAIERESGATVLMKSFRLHWRSQTVRIDGLALTGPQKNAEMAFLSAETLIAKFHIISLLRRDVRLTELDIQRPEIHVIMRRDGTTNLGFLKSSRLRSRLVYLRAGIIHIRDGSLDVGSRRSPLAFSGQDLSAVIRCEAEHAGCVVETSIRDLRIIDYPRLNGRLESAISLGPNELVVRSVHWTSGQSEMRLSGRVTSFAERNVQFQVQGRVAGPDLGLRDLGGVFTVDGSGSYRGMDEWNFDGRAQARNVEIQKTPVDASAQLTADARGIEFRQLQIYSSGSKFLGSGKLEKFRDLAVRGRVERLDLHRVALLFSEYSIPWTGALNGPVGVQAQVEMQGHTLNFHDLAVRGDLTITPSTGAIPISGQLTGQYSERTKELTLSKADVALPHSRAAFTGVAGKQLAGSFESTDLQDLKPLVPTYELPAIKSGGTAAFDGTLSGASGDLRVAGNVHLTRANWRGWDLDDARASFDATSTGIRFGSLSLAGPTLQATGSGDIELQNWSVSPNASLSTRLHVAKADLAQLF
ncbi:MAG: hypothetical protein JO108_35910, partial [Acidobacteriaceae bacterium]|nr:hypothetical protein [Acidobacteriaceae bacterium]